MTPTGPRSDERGVALVLTLAILVLVTMLVIAFAVSMRVENTASKNFNDLIKARLFAQAAVDQAVATIRSGTPAITPTETYVTSPGALFTNTSGAWGIIPTFTPITSSGSIDLNAGNLIAGINAVYLSGTPIWAGWSNVVANGRLIGRFSYWIDDESAKVNINVAGSRGNDLAGQTPAAIDLQALFTPNDQVNITNFVSYIHPFDTLESIKQVTNNSAYPVLYPGYVYPNPLEYINQADYFTNQFYMTVNSSSPDITPWGAKRLNLTQVVATNTPQNAVAQIAAALSDAANLGPWFGGQTFASKYPSVPQIAANIVDYIDTNGNPTDSSPTPITDTTPPLYLGLEQTPYINELVISNAITVAPGASPGTYDYTFNTSSIVELWYMYTNSVGWTPLPGTEVVILNRPDITISAAGSSTTQTLSFVAPPPQAAMTPMSTAVDFTTVTANDTPSGSPINLATNVADVTLSTGTVTVVYRASGPPAERIDYAVIPLTNYTLHIVASVTSTSLNWTASCNDPRVKPVNDDWNATGGGTIQSPGSLGQQNPGGVLDRQVITTNAVAPAVGIRADGDSSCHVISSPSRDRGTMYPGESAFIHTGVPWRTFWLQPQFSTELGTLSGGTGPRAIPDWAVIDMFSATDQTNIVGRININAAVTNANAAPFPVRITPLLALLTNSLTGGSLALITSYSEGVAATNIYDQIPATSFPGAPFSPYSFTWAGEVTEVNGLSNVQLINNAHRKSHREASVRGIANLITTRSDTFTIWAIAQTLRVPVGTTITNVLGEAKVEAVVQRYEDPPGTVKFRTKYFRYIYE